MKANKIEKKSGKHRALTFLALILVGAALCGIAVAYSKLRDLWLEQFVITDPNTQVSVNSGRLVKGDVIAEEFGLRKGANLALIDYDSCRTKALEHNPAIRSLSVTRLPPNRIEIAVVERQPIVRLKLKDRKAAERGCVADADGVAFRCFRRDMTEMLPIIRERNDRATQWGVRLTGRKLAALRLIELASDSEFSEFAILEVDTTHPDYLIATLGNYSIAKIAWDGMDAPTPANQKNLVARLRTLLAAIRASTGLGIKTWDATQPNTVYAKEPTP